MPAPRPNEETSGKTALQTILLIGGLVACVGLLFVIAVQILKPRPAPPQPDAAAVAQEWERIQQIEDKALQAEAEKKRLDAIEQARLDEISRKRAEATAALLYAAGTLLGICFYTFLIFYLGAFVARDGYRRGMNGLGWAAFYFFFQFFFRAAVYVGFSHLPLILAPIGAVGLVLLEPFGWVGFFIYNYARRPGRMTRCPNCVALKLEYLPVCPHCSMVLVRKRKG